MFIAAGVKLKSEPIYGRTEDVALLRSWRLFSSVIYTHYAATRLVEK